jgi:MFS family permease
MARPFIVVYCKEVYGQADAVVTVFTICASLGALATGSVMRLVIDRLGAKPLFIIFAWVSLVSLVPALVAPGIGFAAFSLAFLCLLSAATNMGFVGQENAAQTYFFAMVPKDALMDLSMLYYFILGGTGAIGSVLGGGILDMLRGSGFRPSPHSGFSSSPSSPSSRAGSGFSAASRISGATRFARPSRYSFRRATCAP